ncbi:MAG: DUF6384 family protein [Devosia sp.]
MTDEMLAMDVVDTLRRGIDLPPEAEPETVRARLRLLYAQEGIEVSEAALDQGFAAAADDRFAFTPAHGPAALLARLYVARRGWGPPVLALALAVLVGLGAYFFGYRPYTASLAERERIELAQTLPARMDELYQAIFNETKVQSAVVDAEAIRSRGKDAAAKGNRAGADQAVAELTALRDTLEQSYTLRVADRSGLRPGFWTIPNNNTEATNYYIVVEAVDANGQVLSLPIVNGETGRTEVVNRWGVRVPQGVYDAVIADKQDNGVIDHGLVGFKQDGFVDVDYVVPVLGGTLTQW